ncbi:amino acid ABC transporter substrate-binding protein [Sinirhodobacter populi]|uniref:Amino acid ABC transporter substrate-binding protein n=1 Tax=Paenirhodobacter populi TaxID=2306993 RepID=A0A443K2M9_9RHOB|nr:transporter substrate-binding domain-containing protein [Sinirhodobacter populi]RWR26963.1 amino acid ABC transporter substrate-binding protein [Sinirhodobacter populi]
MKRTILTCLSIGLALAVQTVAAQACTPARTFPTITPGTITVAVYSYPPFATLLDGGNIGGVDSDIVKEIAARNCMTVTPVVVDPSAVIQNVLTKKVDLGIGDWFRTAERAKVLGLSHPMYVDQMAFYSRDGLTTLDELQGKRVGAVSGFLYAGQLERALTSSVMLYPNPVALAQDLMTGRIDVAADSYGTGVYAQSQGAYDGIAIKLAAPDPRVPVSVEPAQIALLSHLSNPELGAAIDAEIQELQAAGKIADILEANGLDRSGAETGAPRLIQ